MSGIKISSLSAAVTPLATDIIPIVSSGSTGTITLANIATIGGGTSNIFNVRLYGALGDGSTDDTTAILATFTAATTGSDPCTVVFPPGNYLFNSGTNAANAIRISTPGVKIVGYGSGYDLTTPSAGTVITQTHFGPPTIMFQSGSDGGSVSGICFTCNQTKQLIDSSVTNSTGRDNGQAIYILDANYITVSDCSFYKHVAGIKSKCSNATDDNLVGNVFQNLRFDHVDYGLLLQQQTRFTIDNIASLTTEYSQSPATLNYLGTWNATTNTPTLVSSTGTHKDLYVVSVAGTHTLDSITTESVGDLIYFDGTHWLKLSPTPPHAIYLNGPTSATFTRCSDGIVSNCTSSDNPYASAFKLKFSDRLVVSNLTAYGCERAGDFEDVDDSTFTNLTAGGMTDTSALTAIHVADSRQGGWNWQDCDRTSITNAHIDVTGQDIPGILVRYSNFSQVDGTSQQALDTTLLGCSVTAAYTSGFTSSAAYMCLGTTRTILSNCSFNNNGSATPPSPGYTSAYAFMFKVSQDRSGINCSNCQLVLPTVLGTNNIYSIASSQSNTRIVRATNLFTSSSPVYTNSGTGTTVQDVGVSTLGVYQTLNKGATLLAGTTEWWRFDDNTGSTITAQISTPTNDLSTTNGPGIWVQDKWGIGYKLNGTNQYLTSGTNAGVGSTGDLFMEIIIHRIPLFPAAYILGGMTVSGSRDFEIAASATVPYVVGYVSDGGGSESNEYFMGIDPGIHHLVLSWNSTSHVLTLYLDGSNVATYTGSTTRSDTTSATLFFGVDANHSQYYSPDEFLLASVGTTHCTDASVLSRYKSLFGLS